MQIFTHIHIQTEVTSYSPHSLNPKINPLFFVMSNSPSALLDWQCTHQSNLQCQGVPAFGLFVGATEGRVHRNCNSWKILKKSSQLDSLSAGMNYNKGSCCTAINTGDLGSANWFWQALLGLKHWGKSINHTSFAGTCPDAKETIKKKKEL